MIATKPPPREAFEARAPLRAAWPWAIALALAAALAWFVYQQLTGVRGVRVDDEPKSMVDIVPLPPLPPPPPPPEPAEKPPEPTEQPQPSPAEAPKAAQPQPQAAPVSIAAPAQAGADAFGLAAGTGGGMGAPASKGTCLGTNCGAGPGGGGGGIGEAAYRGYLNSALQERVRRDDRINRLVFAADFTLSISREGSVTGVRFVDARGNRDEAAMQRIVSILNGVRGLDPPPATMRFPQKITVRGRRSL